MKHSCDLFDYDVSGLFSENEYTRPLNVYRPFPIRYDFKGKGRIIDRFNKMDSDRKMKKGSYDVIHPTYYDPYLLGKNIKPLVITVHDMIHELFPEYFFSDKSTVYNKKVMIFRANKIIAISKCTKNDILKYYPGIDEDKIDVVYHGTSYKDLKSVEKEDYILFTGQRSGYKNFKFFLYAVAPLLLKYNLNLICTGRSFNDEEKWMINNLHITGQTLCKFVSEEKLIDLYSRAIAFVFPSLYEGFGIPVLEAFAAGCPAVLANAGSLPEIGGDGALYFDPYDIKDLRSVVEKLIISPSLQNELIDKGKKKVKEFSWEKCSRETAVVYKDLMDKKYKSSMVRFEII
jgi:glycosyltransferase involved in cell wall biosynthesis